MADSTRLPAEIANEIATVQRDITRPYFSNFMLPDDDTLVSRGGTRSYRIYDDTERDGRVYSCLQKRKLALVSYPWRVDPASDSSLDKQAAELVTQQLTRLNFRNAVTDLMDAVLKGFAVGEILWGIDGNQIVAREIRSRDQRRFRFGTDYQLRLLTWENMLDGEPLPDRKFITHHFGSKDGNPYGLGLGTRLFWYAWFKRQNISFWLTFNDKYGSPTAVGKYPLGTEPADQSKLLAALGAIAQDAGIVIPEGLTIELLEATRSGTVDAYERLTRYLDEQIAEIILGETLSTNVGDGGSFAAAGVHNDVRLELSQADGELLAAAFNKSLVKWIVEFNLPAAQPPELTWAVAQSEDLSARATRDKTISDMGFKPSVEYITETYGGEWSERPAAPAPSFGMGGLGGGDPGDEAFAEPGAPADTVDHFTGRLAKAGGGAVEGMVGAVHKLMHDASSLEDFRDRLIELYPALSPAAFSEIMGQAVLASDLAGRVETR